MNHDSASIANRQVVPVRSIAEKLNLDRSTTHKAIRKAGYETMRFRDPEARGAWSSYLDTESAAAFLAARAAEFAPSA